MKVFISYARENDDLAIDVESQLRKSGIQVQRDKSVLTPGDEWLPQLLKAVRESDAVLLLWSQYASESLNVHQELLEALRHHKRITPLLVDLTPLPPLIHKFQYVRLSRVSEQRLELIEALGFDPLALPEGDIEFEAALNAYRATVRKTFSTLQMLSGRNQLPFETGYLPLDITPGLEASAGSLTHRTDSLSSIFEGPSSLAILAGPPGSGKTTTLRYFFHRWSRSGGERVFCLARLKEYNPVASSSMLDFLRLEAERIFGAKIAQGVLNSEQLSTSAISVLLDGLDEVPDHNYPIFLSQLTNFTTEYPKVSVALTTRIDGFRGRRENDFSRWRRFSLRPFSPDDITQFVNTWCRTPEAIEQVLDALRHPRLQELAKRPFLLALICIVYGSGNAPEHSTRASLYTAAADYLISRHDALPSPFQLRHVSWVLATAAMHYLRLDVQQLNLPLLTALLRDQEQHWTGEQIEALIGSIVERVGLLQNFDLGVGFCHKSFLEFYAAKALASVDNGVEIALAYSQVSAWEEVVRLLTGLLPTDMARSSFVKRLWLKNAPLALRAATDSPGLAASVLGEIVRTAPESDKVAAINEMHGSLTSLDRDQARTLVIETLEPLIAAESSGAVLYTAIQLLRQYDPDDKSDILKRYITGHSRTLYQELTQDSRYKFAFISVPSGQFFMGDSAAQDEQERPSHEVRLDGFLLQKYQVTNLAYERVMGQDCTRRHPVFSPGDDHPVTNITWFDAFIFALRVGCRLPTEAEWEYACRAGETGPYCFGSEMDLLKEYANYEGHPRNAEGLSCTWEVGTGRPNAWGFHDMHGNVWEWCQDWFGSYDQSVQTNPKGPKEGEKRVRRGGGFVYHARGCRSTFRWGNEPTYFFKDIGMRLARSSTP